MNGKQKNDLLFGVGINDADYTLTTNKRINGRNKQVAICPIYLAWSAMLRRCYSEKFQNIYPTYQGCSVSSEWLRFSVFSSWMLQQDYVGNHLDKDILLPGNRVYSPDTCAFVSPKLNTFLNSLSASRGKWPIGVYWHKSIGKFNASCRNPFTGKQESLGLFNSPDDAHEAWRQRKHQHACDFARIQTDSRVAEALRTRYIENLNPKVDTMPSMTESATVRRINAQLERYQHLPTGVIWLVVKDEGGICEMESIERRVVRKPRADLDNPECYRRMP